MIKIALHTTKMKEHNLEINQREDHKKGPSTVLYAGWIPEESKFSKGKLQQWNDTVTEKDGCCCCYCCCCFILLLILCVHMCLMCVGACAPQSACEGQRKTLRNQFSLSRFMWLPVFQFMLHAFTSSILPTEIAHWPHNRVFKETNHKGTLQSQMVLQSLHPVELSPSPFQENAPNCVTQRKFHSLWLPMSLSRIWPQMTSFALVCHIS